MSSGSQIRNAVDDALAGRRYKFVVHGISDARRRQPSRGAKKRSGSRGQGQSRSKRQSTQPYSVDNPDDFNLNEFVKPERLFGVFRILEREGGHAAGKDGLTYSDFRSTEVYNILRFVSTQILNHRYRPHPTRLVRIAKANGGTRKLKLNRIIDRVIAKALQLALDGYWRRQLPRLGKDVWDVFANMQRAMREQNAFVLGNDDIENCFPSTPIVPVMECHRQHISQPDLLWLIKTIVRGHDGLGHTIGLYQGSPCSPVASELLLHTHLDARLEAEFRGFPRMLRYVDNLNIVCRSESEGCEVLQFCKTILNEIGLSLKSEDGPPRDIRDKDFNRTVLGLNPHWKNGNLTFSIPDSANEKLKVKFAKAAISQTPSCTALAIAEGWINKVGPALTSATSQTIVSDVINAARECGFCELRHRHLREVGRKARKRWLEFSNCKGVPEHV